jgi:prepilin-type N-terminal cleavage/methylation domain-containing protein
VKVKDNGFTLIEIIITLLLVGIISVFATFGLLDITKGYVQGVSNMVTSMKASIALSRLYHELSNLNDIESAAESSILFSRENSTIGMAKIGNSLYMQENSVPNDETAPVLIDSVESFTLSYFQNDGTVWTSGEAINDLARIELMITLVNQSIPVSFTTTVNPIYNNTYNGPYSD